MGFPPWRVQGGLRVSLGPTTEPADVERFLAAFTKVLRRLRPDWGVGEGGAQ